MRGFFNYLLYPIYVALFMLPIVLGLVLVTIVTNLFLGVWQPITKPIRSAMETVSELVPSPLDKIPSFPKIKRYLGSTKNILFILFVLIFLVIHYLSLGHVNISVLNVPQLFPGSAFDSIISFAIAQGKLDISSFVVNPEDYLRTILFSGITGLFLHVGCTTKDEGAKIPFLVKLVYILLITLFSSVVLGKIPSDMFTITLPEFSSQLESLDIGRDNLIAEGMLTTLWQCIKILWENLITLIPAIVAVFFLCKSVSGFAAAFAGGCLALAVLGFACPQVFTNPDSFWSGVLLLVAVSLAEAVALLLGEFVDKIADRVIQKIGSVFAYYNVVSLMISYFFYPTLALPILRLFLGITMGTDFVNGLLSVAGLSVFTLVTLAGFKVNQWVWKDEETINGKRYAILMIINIPIWIVYGAMFNILLK